MKGAPRTNRLRSCSPRAGSLGFEYVRSKAPGKPADVASGRCGGNSARQVADAGFKAGQASNDRSASQPGVSPGDVQGVVPRGGLSHSIFNANEISSLTIAGQVDLYHHLVPFAAVRAKQTPRIRLFPFEQQTAGSMASRLKRRLIRDVRCHLVAG